MIEVIFFYMWGGHIGLQFSTEAVPGVMQTEVQLLIKRENLELNGFPPLPPRDSHPLHPTFLIWIRQIVMRVASSRQGEMGVVFAYRTDGQELPILECCSSKKQNEQL